MLQTLKRLIIVGLVSLSSPTFADITQVDNAALEKLQADGAVIIDVRRQDEWEIASLLDKRLGYSAVHNVTKGIHDWLEENRPVVTYEP